MSAIANTLAHNIDLRNPTGTTMSNLEKLLAKGAYSAAGDIIFKNKSLGQMRNGVFAINEAGLAELEIEDVEVKEVKPRAKRLKNEADTAEADVLTQAA